MRLAIGCLLALGAILMAGSSEASGKKVVCYYTNWSTYRPGKGKYTPDDIDARLCTHVLYSFLVARENKVTIHDSWIDVDSGYFEKVVAAKQRNPELKVMMAVGGWTNGSPPFSSMARTSQGRKTFIDSALEIITKYNFDGLDLDWEYPALRGGVASDKNNFNLLIQEFQAAFKRYGRQFNKPKPLLSAAVGPAPKTANVAYDKNAICRDLDFVNLMQYDIHGAWEKRTGFLAPLRNTQGEATPENVLEKTTQDWINAGCSRDKLIFGIPLYGRGWKTTATTVHSSASGAGQQGQFTREAGYLSYYEICEKISQKGWKESYDNQAEQAIAYGEGQLYTYDNERSVKAKVDYINQQQLGGAMVWALDLDDFTGGFCNRGKYPLLTAINKQLGIPPKTTLPPPPTTTEDPSCTRWWCPKKTTTTKPTRRTTTPQVTTRGTTTPVNGCAPECTASNMGRYIADRCDERKFYICSHTRYELTCPLNTYFDTRCSCCNNKQKQRDRQRQRQRSHRAQRRG